MSGATEGSSTRLGWWENSVTNHRDVRAAFASALTRTVDVDEDIGVPPSLSLVRINGGRGRGNLGREKLATTLAMAQVPVRANARAWELTAHPSLESRRTAGWLREVSDVAEEMLPGRVERLMIHVEGPWSIGASVEYRGHALIEDRPAFRDMALNLGEGVDEFARLGERIGAQVVLAVHEPRVAEVLRGLEGATDFDPVRAVDREIVAGVWQRFLEQLGIGQCSDASGQGVRRLATLDCEGAVPEEVVDVLPGMAAGFARVVVPACQLEGVVGKDLIGGMLGQLLPQGRGIGWADGDTPDRSAATPAGSGPAAVRDPETIARTVIRQWDQWSFPADQLPGAVDVVVPEGARTIAGASIAAARARQAASLLWRN
ncbi:hypothetical protein [Corynebacterium heidelbergense]|uniref:Uncharacterized protein n=1 Tax=Corynebacterium heidelbergense TaxID=2055947 RepID=A0A364V3I3_9CORY|nr:hypothetical protein [Corynebacterium heidelbergense]RAV31187.1 hypothetical protein DLJ54_09720 [Corynebacterium heidelbergense]